MGTLTVRVTGTQGFLHDMLLPAMNVPGLGRHLFSEGTAALKGINTVIAKESYLDVRQFKIPLRKDTECPTLDYLNLELAPRGNYQTEAAFPTRVTSGHAIPTGSALASRLLRSGAMGAASAFTVTTSSLAPTTTPGLPTTTATTTSAMPATAMAAAGANVWPQRLGHPNERTMQVARNIAETGVNFTDSLTACDIFKINQGTKQPICNKPGKSEITEWLQLVSIDFLGPVTPAARVDYRFMAKYSDHFTKFKGVYFIPTKDKALMTLVKFVQDLVMPLGLRLQHLRADGGGEFTADYYRDYCKTTVTIQQFSSPNTPEQNGLSERDGRTIMDVARCLPNGAALPKSGGKWRSQRCFYSTACRTRPSATTRRTTGCLANTSTCHFSELLEPVASSTTKGTSASWTQGRVRGSSLAATTTSQPT